MPGNTDAAQAQWAQMYPRLIELCRDRSLTAADIAEILNNEFQPAILVTRNAVIGKVARSGLRRPEATRLRIKSTVPFNPPPPRPPPQSVPAGGLTIIELEPHHCRWPAAGEKAAMRYCGANRIEGSPYCPAHSTMAFNKR